MNHKTMSPKEKIQRYKDLIKEMAELLSKQSYSQTEWNELHKEAQHLDNEIGEWKRALENESRWG